MDRSTEETRELLRREFNRTLFTDARIQDTGLMLRYVDNEALLKCRLTTFDQMGKQTRRLVSRTGDYDDMQKYRDRITEAGRVCAATWDLDETVEETYFKMFGEDFEGNKEQCAHTHSSYRCACGNRFLPPLKNMPERCPGCNRLTPIGRIIEAKRPKR